MNLNYMFVGTFLFFVIFAGLLSTMPGEFLALGVGTTVQDKEVQDYFNEHNVLAYNNTLKINLTYGSAESDQFGLPDGQKIEFWWDQFGAYGTYIDMFQVRHLTWEWWWWAWHCLEVQEPYANQINYSEYGLTKNGLLVLFVEEYNASYCEFACEHGISVKMFILTANESWTLEESWDNHKLKLYTSYDIDWTKTGTSMWHVMSQLLSFQNPQLGIPGVGGQILSAILGGALWADIALLFFSFITSVIPFIRGWVGGGG